MLLWVKRSETGGIILRCKVLDSSVSTGAGLTGLSSASSGLIIAAIADVEATTTTYTVAGSNVETITTLGTYAAPTSGKCRFKEVDSTNHPGVYEIHLAVARYGVSSSRSLLVSLSGATNMAQTDFVIQLAALDPEVLQAPASTALSTAVWTNTLATDLGTTNSTVATNLNATISSRLASGDYSSPPSASTISTQVASDLLSAHGSGSWTTATGFATPDNVTDAVTSIKGVDGDTLETLSDQIDGIDGGGATVTVLPATGIVADRSAGITLLPVIGETISQAITVYQSDGTTAVNLSAKTLAIIFETMSGVDVAVVDDSDITVGGTGSNVVTFAYPSAVTSSERVLRFAIRDAAAPLTMYLQGICSVVAAPKVDA